MDVDRYYKYVQVVELDPLTGATRTLFTGTSDTHVDLNTSGSFHKPAFMPLPDTNELLWYSDRSGWAHYFRYDLKTGELKNAITSGDWRV